MVDTVRTVGPSQAPNDRGSPPTEWFQIDGTTVERRVQNRRFRIFRAAKEQRWKHVRHLTKRLLRSYANRLVSVRRITQVHHGRHTPGIDGERVTTPEERAPLVDDLRQYQPWKAAPVRRVYIPKANGKQRPLGIPTLRDRVLQMVVKNALEPRFEAEFEAQSDGFRPGRCCQDAIEEVDVALNNGAVGHHHYILDADIPGAFDHISHDFILHRIGPMPGRELVKQWLQAGYWECGTLHHTTDGTPQGGVVTPPTILQTFFFRARIAWAWIDPEHHVHLVMGHLHALDQRADQLPFPAPIRLCQPRSDLRRKVLQPPNNQAQVSVQGLLLGELLALRFHMGEPLAEPSDPGLELMLFNERISVTVDQPRQPLPQLAQLRFERGQGRVPCGAVGVQPPPVFLRQPRGLGQQRTDLLPHRQIQQIRAYLGILTDPFAPKTVGISAQAPVIGICPG